MMVMVMRRRMMMVMIRMMVIIIINIIDKDEQYPDLRVAVLLGCCSDANGFSSNDDGMMVTLGVWASTFR